MRDDCVDWPAPWQMLIHVHSSWLITEKHQNIAIAVCWLRAETISDRFNRPTINKGNEQIPWPSTQSDYCLKSYRQTKSSDRQFQKQKQSKRDSWDSQKKQLRNQNTGSRRTCRWWTGGLRWSWWSQYQMWGRSSAVGALLLKIELL